MKLLRTLLEGGNVFKSKDGEPLTQRINQADVPATIAWVEQVTGLKFPEERQLGSTGRKPTSGDLDLGVDANKITKDQLAATLTQFVQSQGQDPREYVRKAGEVHFRTPIAGDPDRGFVQTDFMFFPDLDWGQFYYGGADNTEYKGMNRAVLWSSMAKHHGLKVGSNGVLNRTTNEVISTNPDQFAQWVLGRGYNRNNLKSVESIYAALTNNPDSDAMLRDFRDYLAKQGLNEPQVGVQESDTGFLGRLRDRLVNQGMQPILEAEQASVGGRAKGIEHLEDWVFREGTAGIQRALEIVKHATESPAKTTTAKWDGMPAIIWGRKPATGEFVLTDGSGFEAKGYDGLATSPEMMAQIQNTRKGDRTSIINLYTKLFPVLEASLPPNFRGYVKGDLLYANTPPEIAGNYVFQPNTIEYKIPARSNLGQRIGNSNIGIAVHSMYSDVGDARQPLKGVKFTEVPGLMLERPATPSALAAEPAKVKQLKQLIRTDGAAISTLFNPTELRAHKITDLAKLCVDYINTKVGTPLNPNTLLPEFGEWLQRKVTPSKFRNIVEYLESPSSNSSALAAAFTAFLLLHDLKMDILRQADLEHPGQEGWVMATPAGYAKAVNRFDPNAFAAQNKQRNNPQGV
jgi:hypothetical protein